MGGGTQKPAPPRQDFYSQEQFYLPPFTCSIQDFCLSNFDFFVWQTKNRKVSRLKEQSLFVAQKNFGVLGQILVPACPPPHPPSYSLKAPPWRENLNTPPVIEKTPTLCSHTPCQCVIVPLGRSLEGYYRGPIGLTHSQVTYKKYVSKHVLTHFECFFPFLESFCLKTWLLRKPTPTKLDSYLRPNIVRILVKGLV